MVLGRLLDKVLPGPGRYGAALLLLLASVFLVMAFPRGTVPEAVALVIQMLALVGCLRAAEAPRRLIRVLETLAVAAVVVGLVSFVWGSEVQKEFVRLTTFVLVFTSLPSIVLGQIRQMRRERAITLKTVFGALCIYLLLIISFASAFAIAGVLGDSGFFVQGGDNDNYGNFVYFATTTITTLGLGDLTPATDLGKALTGTLALFGQIYVVTVVALIIGNLGRKAKDSGDDADGDA